MVTLAPPPDKKNKSEEFIYQHISDAILEQRLAPGTKLTEESLSDIFGASRTVIRRALTRLNYENVVEIRPNRGAIVACPTIEQALQIFEARRIVEKAVIKACVKKHTQDDLEKLKHLVETERSCVDRNERVAWIRLTGDFHLEIAHIAGNEVIAKFLKELVSQTSLIIALYGNTSGSLCSSDDHHLIVEAIGHKDEQKAMTLMMHHLDECIDSLNMDNKEETQDLKSIFSNVDA
jgi:DNA-binding GntR family transcriptional regulator